MQLERIGPYEIIHPIASGGMAEVYLGRKTGPGGFEKRVVLKRINKKLLGDSEIEAMFVDEARVQALLDHPNVVQIYDFGEEDGSYFIAMEFVNGCTLRWVIDNAIAVERPMPIHHALRVVADVCAGLNSAHNLKGPNGSPIGLIHRDISPVNVLISRNGVAKLCDFGIAKSQLQRVFTRVGFVKGKFRYMSPEQLNAEALDPRADIFSVGVCLWEMLTGQRLFNQSEDEEIASAIRAGDYPRASKFRSSMPRALDRVCRRALAHNRSDRFKTAREFQLACEEIIRLLPAGSCSATLGAYIQAELDGTAGLAPSRQKTPEGASAFASGLELLDPPVPHHPTVITRIESEISRSQSERSVEVKTQKKAKTAPAWSKAASLVLLSPALAVGAAARGIELLFRKRPKTMPEVQVTRITPLEDLLPPDPDSMG
ncbi:MAG: serine/threonine protein kinase [Deltaproteobacteria bacterium]|nr:serine/threonine protein kinase [Deltaproteobacteria bacterium]